MMELKAFTSAGSTEGPFVGPGHVLNVTVGRPPSAGERVAESVDWNGYLDGHARTDALAVLIDSAIADAVKTEREQIAMMVQTWAQDDKTVQPTFLGMVAAIRKRGAR